MIKGLKNDPEAVRYYSTFSWYCAQTGLLVLIWRIWRSFTLRLFVINLYLFIPESASLWLQLWRKMIGLQSASLSTCTWKCTYRCRKLLWKHGEASMTKLMLKEFELEVWRVNKCVSIQRYKMVPGQIKVKTACCLNSRQQSNTLTSTTKYCVYCWMKYLFTVDVQAKLRFLWTVGCK